MKKCHVRYKLTDQGNAERFRHHWAGELIYVPGIGWHIWLAGRWVQASKGEEVECAKKTIRAMYSEAADCSDDDEYRAALAEHAVKCEQEKKLMAMLRLAQSDPAIAVSANQLDADPFALNTLNGVVDLRTGNLRPHNPSEFHTKQCPVNYDPAARYPVFMQFIEKIMAGNERLIAYVQKVLGNAVSGDANSQFFPIFWGEGANGKSTLLGIAQHVLGDYASIASDSLLTVGRQEHPTELADLQGRRLVVASETEEGGRLRAQLMKRLTGETRVKARRMRQDFYEFDRTHHIILQTNNRPRIDEDSEAVFRRIRLVPFSTIIPMPERDVHLLDKLKAEASGVLTWLVMGCLAWQHEGLDMPPEVANANQSYREDSNPLGEFVDDLCAIGPGVSTGAGQLRQAYERHCTERGIKPISGNKFAERLLKMGFERGRNHAGRLWAGIGLLCSQHEYAGEA